MQEVWDRAKTGIEQAQARQRSQANRHRREEAFGVGDYVMVTTKNWDRLELPESIKVHPIFSPEKLRRAAKTEPLNGQTADPQPPITVDGQDEWEVEQILAVRLIRKRLFYRVKWLGHDDDLTWYPARNFKNSPHRIRDFHVQYPNLAGPPKRLAEWLKATDEDVFLEDHEEDDKPQE